MVRRLDIAWRNDPLLVNVVYLKPAKPERSDNGPVERGFGSCSFNRDEYRTGLSGGFCKRNLRIGESTGDVFAHGVGTPVKPDRSLTAAPLKHSIATLHAASCVAAKFVDSSVQFCAASGPQVAINVGSVVCGQ